MAPAAADRPHFPEMAARAFQDDSGRREPQVRPRTAYSLRHTYICLRLMEGADIYQITKNCRTSVEMIEKYDAAHIKTQRDLRSSACAADEGWRGPVKRVMGKVWARKKLRLASIVLIPHAACRTPHSPYSPPRLPIGTFLSRTCVNDS